MMPARAFFHVLEEDRRTPRWAHLCKRARFTQSDCTLCADLCPERAIAFETGPVVEHTCTGCGLCQAVCPTEVFQNDRHSDEQLLHEIAPRVERRRHPAAGTRIRVRCREAEGHPEDCLAVTCLGGLTETFLLGVALLKVDALTLARGKCSTCRLFAGEGLLSSALRTFARSLTLLADRQLVIDIEERPRGGRKRESLVRRRSVLTMFSAEDAKPSAPAVGTRSSDKRRLQNRAHTRRPPSKTLTQELLDKATSAGEPQRESKARSVFDCVKIDQERCSACGICVTLCPTGALARSVDDGWLSHHFDASLCNGCRLCAEACQENAISFASHARVCDMREKTPVALTRMKMATCAICGEQIRKSEGSFCVTCEKRQMSSRFRGTAYLS